MKNLYVSQTNFQIEFNKENNSYEDFNIYSSHLDESDSLVSDSKETLLKRCLEWFNLEVRSDSYFSSLEKLPEVVETNVGKNSIEIDATYKDEGNTYHLQIIYSFFKKPNEVTYKEEGNKEIKITERFPHYIEISSKEPKELRS